MLASVLVVLISYGLSYGAAQFCGPCQQVNTVDLTAEYIYANQPVYVNFVPDIPDNRLVDNVCITYFQLPDTPQTYTIYTSRVYADGSNQIQTAITTKIDKGTNLVGSPYQVVTGYNFAYVDCDTYVIYRCINYNPVSCLPYVFGTSFSQNRLPLSCLRSVDRALEAACLPDMDFYVLPMKLHTRCVTQQICTLPCNPFYQTPDHGMLP